VALAKQKGIFPSLVSAKQWSSMLEKDFSALQSGFLDWVAYISEWCLV
jgi:hypothetical protein